jgi:hypothetical protein
VVTMLPLTWEDNKAVWFVLASLLGFAQVREGPAAWTTQRTRTQAKPLVRSPVQRVQRPVVQPVPRGRWNNSL